MRIPEPEADCRLHPDVEVRASAIEGRRLFARAPIPAGTPVSRVGGASCCVDFRMECACGSPLCRGVVTGEDWRRGELRERYGGHWIPVLGERIGNEGATRAGGSGN